MKRYFAQQNVAKIQFIRPHHKHLWHIKIHNFTKENFKLFRNKIDWHFEALVVERKFSKLFSSSFKKSFYDKRVFSQYYILTVHEGTKRVSKTYNMLKISKVVLDNQPSANVDEFVTFWHKILKLTNISIPNCNLVFVAFYDESLIWIDKENVLMNEIFYISPWITAVYCNTALTYANDFIIVTKMQYFCGN